MGLAKQTPLLGLWVIAMHWALPALLPVYFFGGMIVTGTHCIPFQCWYAELNKTNAEYGVKLASGKASNKSLKMLSWNIDDLTQLNEEGRKLLVNLRCIQQLADATEERFVIRHDSSLCFAAVFLNSYKIFTVSVMFLLHTYLCPWLAQRNTIESHMLYQCNATSLKHGMCWTT